MFSGLLGNIKATSIIMENIVYILGAGFSAPLGLPVMSNFWEKSKSMPRKDLGKYEYFNDIIGAMDETKRVQSYFEYVDWNIEEVLSILEFTHFFEQDAKLNQFKKYIIDVLDYYTPKLASPQKLVLNSLWYSQLFGVENVHTYFGHFVANLFNLSVSAQNIDNFGRKIPEMKWYQRKGQNYRYSIISLNYDMVLENIVDYINRISNRSVKLEFSKYYDNNGFNPVLIKLHGSADSGEIILPTFNKGLYQKQLPESWKNAFDVLKSANQIRIIGYSIPQTDSYIKFLLKAAISKSRELDRVDVLCADDPTSTVKSRYNNFIKFNNYRYRNDFTENMLNGLYNLDVNHNRNEQMKKNGGVYLNMDEKKEFDFCRLEDAHNQAMK